MDVDIPQIKFDCLIAIDGIDDYWRGEDRFVYEYIYTTEGKLAIHLINCKGHYYKNEHFSII